MSEKLLLCFDFCDNYDKSKCPNTCVSIPAKINGKDISTCIRYKKSEFLEWFYIYFETIFRFRLASGFNKHMIQAAFEAGQSQALADERARINKAIDEEINKLEKDGVKIDYFVNAFSLLKKKAKEIVNGGK